MSTLLFNLKDWLYRNGLFLKVFGVTLLSVILVAILISVSTLRISTTYFMDTFSLTNERIISESKRRFDDYTSAVVSALQDVESSGTIKRVLAIDETSSINHAQNAYDIVTEIRRIYERIQPEGANLMVLGPYEDLYNMNYSYWPVTYDQLSSWSFNNKLTTEPNSIHYAMVETDNEPLIVAGKALTNQFTSGTYGFSYVAIKEKELRTFYEGYTTKENSMVLLNKEGVVLSSNQSSWVGNKLDQLKIMIERDPLTSELTESVSIYGTDYHVLMAYITGLDMYLVNLIDQETIVGNLINTKELVLIMTGIVLVATILSWLISRHITLSLTRLVRQIAKLNKHNFTRRLKEEGGYESTQIARAFNYTLDELDQYVTVVVESQKKQRDAELRALQHQINPHFLYNTLTTVKFMVRHEQTDEAIETIHALINLLQNTLGEVGETVTVEQELDNMKHYVKINQARYGDQIRVNFFVAPDVYQYHLPKLVLQPFIENAFFHAFNEKKTGFIQIMIRKQGEDLYCEVTDDGDGMTLSKEQFPYVVNHKRQMFSGIGMKNVQERIHLLYGNQYDVTVKSEPGQGTRVIVTLPLLKKT
ncbi:two-component system, sensor histidine kinase YesM [Halolactibacillus halophilus]|uniref:histidine kinase n=1 Tax=Halolactibacillus halophilus TaxID=306540 RepID=A0A1I5Q8X4_9BACI|nr:sensor histidine kinase [Halolactibacillus halophilus]GEM01650.1 histidine kinase [Halolactibacillus halophilus]SFP42510.1 two-component system, sensor histidine kinase YesM [Halolactibacillus halophilus]